jgi:hypothetical protein
VGASSSRLPARVVRDEMMNLFRTQRSVARCGALGLLVAALAGGFLLFSGDAQPGRETPQHAGKAIAVRIPEAVEAVEPLTRREQAASGARPLRAADGPGIQGWLSVDGTELPAWLAVRGAGAPRDGRVAVAADGHFAIPEAVQGARILIALPDHLVTSEAPSDDSVIGSRYVHLVAPARVDVLAQTLASALQVRLLLPDGGAPAAGLRVLCRLDGPSARDFTLEADAQGWLAAPLPTDGWCSTLRMSPLALERTLYDRLYLRRVDVPASGVYGGLRLRRSAVVTLRFLDPLDRPVPDVVAEEPDVSTTSDADGLLLVRDDDRARAAWRHERFVTSQAVWPAPPDVAEIIVRMVPPGNWVLTLGTPSDDDVHALLFMPRAFDVPASGKPPREFMLPRLAEAGWQQWSLDNRLIGRGDGLRYEWCGIPIRIEPIELAPGADAARTIAPANFTQYEVQLFLHDGSPAAKASVRCMRYRERADEDGWVRFALPDAIGKLTLSFHDGLGGPPIEFHFRDGSRPAVPTTLRFERTLPLMVAVTVKQGEPPTLLRVTDSDGATPLTANVRLEAGRGQGGAFPPGRRLFLVQARGFEQISLWHDVSSQEPLHILLERMSE